MTHISSDRETSRQEEAVDFIERKWARQLEKVMKNFIESLVNKFQKYALRKLEEHQKELKV
jgi:hypothetical protein